MSKILYPNIPSAFRSVPWNIQNPCFLCEWDSRARELHYLQKEWSHRQNVAVGEKNIQHPALIEAHKILLPPLHIKLGLMKNFVKTMDRTSPAFRYLHEKIPRLSKAKIKEGVFVGPQIRELFKNDRFNNLLQGDVKQAWNAFHLVSTNFLRNVRAENYKELVQDMLMQYRKLDCNMSLKIGFLHSHLDFFPDNCVWLVMNMTNVFTKISMVHYHAG